MTKVLLFVVMAASMGCAGGAVQLQTPRYTLSHPDFWKVQKVAQKDGEPTVVSIGQYGDAVIDDGAGSMNESKRDNYESVTADVEVRLYAWADPGTSGDPTQEVAKLLDLDPDLKLQQAMLVADNPPECGVYPKKQRILGMDQMPLDLVSRPGWRTIIVGGKASGTLLAAVARVEYQQDIRRFCHDLSNMRVQLQNLLDGIVPKAVAPAPAVEPAKSP